jgi:type I restriction enzyme, S subunit
VELKPGYKLTEVGVIPEDWKVCPLGKMTTSVASGKSKVGGAAGGYPVHGSTGVIGHSENPEYTGDAILVARVGANAGRLNVVSGRYGVTDNTIMVRLGAEACLPFLRWQLESKRLNSLVFGSGQPLLTGTQLKSLPVCMPPPSQQYAIAQALGDVDDLIACLEKLIAKKRDLKQAAMQGLLTGRTRLPGFLDDWKPRSVRDVLRYERPDAYIVTSSDYSDVGVPVLTANKSVILGYTTEQTGICHDIPAVIFDDFTTDSKYIDYPFKVKSSAIKILRCRRPEDSLAFVYGRMQSLRLAPGEHKRHYISDYQPLELMMPEPEEQAAIAAVLSDMDSEIEALGGRLAKTRDLKQGMMQELLTGRTRLV